MSRVHQLIFGHRERIAGTVYGTIVVMAAIAAGSHDASSAWQLAGIAAATVLVLWIAHVYADALGETITLGRRLDAGELLSVAHRELAIPLAAVAPVAALALGGLGLLKESTSGWLAMGFGLATLVAQGIRYAGAEGLGRLGTSISVAVNLALGLVIVGLKAITH